MGCRIRVLLGYMLAVFITVSCGEVTESPVSSSAATKPVVATGSDEGHARSIGAMIASYERNGNLGLLRAATQAVLQMVNAGNPELLNLALSTAEDHGSLNASGTLITMGEAAIASDLGPDLLDFAQPLPAQFTGADLDDQNGISFTGVMPTGTTIRVCTTSTCLGELRSGAEGVQYVDFQTLSSPERIVFQSVNASHIEDFVFSTQDVLTIQFTGQVPISFTPTSDIVVPKNINTDALNNFASVWAAEDGTMYLQLSLTELDHVGPFTYAEAVSRGQL